MCRIGRSFYDLKRVEQNGHTIERTWVGKATRISGRSYPVGERYGFPFRESDRARCLNKRFWSWLGLPIKLESPYVGAPGPSGMMERAGFQILLRVANGLLRISDEVRPEASTPWAAFRAISLPYLSEI